MAELAIGIVSLATLFSGFFDSVERVSQLKGVRGDLESCVTALEFERFRLQYISDRLPTHQLDHTSGKFLEWLRDGITVEAKQIADTILKYHPGLQHRATFPVAAQSSQYLPSNKPGSINVVRKVTWITSDKKEVAERLNTRQQYTASLWTFATTEAEKIRGSYFLRTRIIATDDEDELGRLTSADMDGYCGISTAARVKQLLLLDSQVWRLAMIASC